MSAEAIAIAGVGVAQLAVLVPAVVRRPEPSPRWSRHAPHGRSTVGLDKLPVIQVSHVYHL